MVEHQGSRTHEINSQTAIRNKKQDPLSQGVSKIWQVVNPILSGGGHYGPDDHERPRCFRRVRATTTKIHDFVSVYV